MNLHEYLSSPGALSVAQLRERAGVKSDAQIRQWQHGYAGRKPSAGYCVAIEKATGAQVTRQELRPDDWAGIWPELEEKQPVAPASRAQPAIKTEAEVAHE